MNLYESIKNNLKENENDKRMILVSDIDWETDGQEIELPKEIGIRFGDLNIENIENDEEVQEKINNYLSNTYDYLINNYKYEIKDNYLHNTNESDNDSTSLVKIYQVKEDRTPEGRIEVPYIFMPYSFAEKNGLKMADYIEVADIEVPTETDLEEIFRLGNTNKDAFNIKDNFRSISVSDIIEKDGKKYYVDSFGFKEIPNNINEAVKVGPVYNVGSEEFIKSFNNIRIDEVGITLEDIELFKRVDTSEEAPDKVNYLLVADIRYDGDKSTSQSIVYNITDGEWEQEFEPSFVGVNPDSDLYFTVLEDVKSTIENMVINLGL